MIPPRIVVFAKAPVAGRVKTRLRLPPETALLLHDAFVRDTIAMALKAGDSVELSTDSATPAWPDLPVARSVQAPGDLGQRLLTAIAAHFDAGSGPVLIIGSDAPTLPCTHIRALTDVVADVAIGPAEDGGFWGICCRRFHPAMFAGVEWSTERTLETTLEAIGRTGLTVARGPCWYDVDEPEDLDRLAAEAVLLPSVRLAREAVAATRRGVS